MNWYTKFRRILESKSKRILALTARRQILRSKDASALGVLYTSTSLPLSEHSSLLQVASRVPRGVICLLSSLQFHKLTTEVPSQVWIAIDVKAWTPRVVSPATRFIRMSGPALHSGVKEYRVRGGSLKVYTPAKTIVDCFKFRNKIGLEVALEALRECRRLEKPSIDEIWVAAKICRVANVMRPYLEALW